MTRRLHWKLPGCGLEWTSPTSDMIVLHDTGDETGGGILAPVVHGRETAEDGGQRLALQELEDPGPLPTGSCGCRNGRQPPPLAAVSRFPSANSDTSIPMCKRTLAPIPPRTALPEKT